jgi:hypothetical protein
MLDTNFLAIEGTSLAPGDSGRPQVRTKTRAQHAAAASLGSRRSNLKCVVESTLQNTMSNFPLQVQDPPPLSPASWPPDLQETIIPVLLNPAANPQIDDQNPVPPVGLLKSHRSVNNPYVDPPVHQLVVVNNAASTIHSPEDGPIKDCYGWDPMLDGEICQTTCMSRSLVTLGR